jgi:uncharacterized protein (UPF0261 family)
MSTVVIIGTLDTKGEELALAKRLIEGHGCRVIVMDAGIGDPVHVAPDITADAVAVAAGSSIAALRAAKDRGAAMAAMAEGAIKLARGLHAAGKLDAIFSLGGSGGSSIATAAMRALPVGVPKLMVSTLAAGNVAPYVGTSDIMMMYPVIDFAGLNIISKRIITNAAAAVAAMAKTEGGPIVPARPVVAITMFGVTTPAATVARTFLEKAGYEVLVFHANGAGGRTMEALMRDGIVAGVLDLTTTELADELVGGTLSAGPDRLEMAGKLGLPQVVSLGALDMVNFGPPETVPERFAGRIFYRHNPMVTLMRTTPEECAALGAMIAEKLNRAEGPVAVHIPSRGVSAIATPGGVFYDPAADRALVSALTAGLDPRIGCIVEDTDINNPQFALAMARHLHAFLQQGSVT